MKNTSTHVAFILSGPRWLTLFEVKDELRRRGIRIILTSVSARVRELRQRRFGGWTVKRRPTKVKGVFAYHAERKGKR